MENSPRFPLSSALFFLIGVLLMRTKSQSEQKDDFK